MNITEVALLICQERRGYLRAFASIVLDESLSIRDLRIIDGPRLFVSMPNRQ